MNLFLVRNSRWLFLSLGCAFIFSCADKSPKQNLIDRFALVSRHNVVLHEADTLGSLSVGNGEFAFTVDVTGLQTFPEDYENGISLGTQTQWAWHSTPSSENFSLNDVAKEYESCDGEKSPYAIQQSAGRAGEATKYLRANPHRLHLGLVGLIVLKENGDEIKLEDVKNIDQHLDLWTGKIESKFSVEGQPVHIITYANQMTDAVSAKIESPLIRLNRLKIKIRFPYGNECHVCPGYEWSQPARHKSLLTDLAGRSASIRREIDSTVYFTALKWSDGNVSAKQAHEFHLEPDPLKGSFEFSVAFSKSQLDQPLDYSETEKSSVEGWKNFWLQGGAVDFSACTDPRAKELERRVVLSQYLTKIQCSGTLPPQETGLTMNSWFGKFHLEMHWWHAAHFALWDRAPLLEKSMTWYSTTMKKAIATAQWQGYNGARWQKMTDPEGNESPSGIGAFIIWQQPHPIYFSELIYRNNPTREILEKYQAIVFKTADFMISFLKFKDGKFQLCHPLIPAQEIFKPESTDNPTYELQYWYFGIRVAQEWRKRLDLEPNKDYEKILTALVPLSVSDGMYLPNSTTPSAYTDSQFRRDHPAVVGALGFLPLNDRLDERTMAKTFDAIMEHWQWETTWGWDYPLLAMTAARLSKPEMAVNALLMDVQKNTYLVNGHNYQDKRLRLYLPGNGGLLAVVAMMSAGWDGNEISNPGFPKNGEWNIKWENLKPMP
jgi:hypothetical protein